MSAKALRSCDELTPTGVPMKPTPKFHHLLRDHALAVGLAYLTKTDALTEVARAILAHRCS